MNLEERIIELLAEYLKKGDQLTDRADRTERSIEMMSSALDRTERSIEMMSSALDRTERGIEIMSRALADNDVKFIAMNEKFMAMEEKTNEKFIAMNEKFNVVGQEIKQLREDQGIMLKELVSLSKRVAVVEEKH